MVRSAAARKRQRQNRLLRLRAGVVAPYILTGAGPTKVKKAKKPTVPKVPKAPQPTRTPVGDAIAGIGGVLGELGGSYLFPGVAGIGNAGKAVGDAIGGGLSKILGFGAYKVSKNSLISPPNVPFMHSTRSSCRICDREYLGDIISSSTAGSWLSTSYTINPGLAATFPWLSNIAVNFEQYKVHGLAFYFRATSAVFNATNQALGTVVLATNYNALAPAYLNKVQAESSMWCTSGKPCEDQLGLIECDPKQTTGNDLFFIRSGAVPSGQDAREFDMGQFQIATVGVAAASQNLGELWAIYDVEFLKPYNGPNMGSSLPAAHYYNITSADVTASYPLGQTHTLMKYDNIGLTLSSTVITIPVGTVGSFMLSIIYTGTSTASLSNPSISPVNAVVKSVFTTSATVDNSGFIAIANGGTSTQMNLLYTFVINPGYSSPTTLTLGTGGTLPATIVDFDLFLLQINNNLS